MTEDVMHGFHHFQDATLRDVTWAPLALLVALAQVDEAINSEETAVLLNYVEAARGFYRLPDRGLDGRLLVQDAVETKVTPKLIRRAAAAVVISECCRHLLPHHFAAMAVADGLPNSRERNSILDLKAAVRNAAK